MRAEDFIAEAEALKDLKARAIAKQRHAYDYDAWAPVMAQLIFLKGALERVPMVDWPRCAKALAA